MSSTMMSNMSDLTNQTLTDQAVCTTTEVSEKKPLAPLLPNLVDDLKAFCKETTCHGVRYLFRGSRAARFFWATAVACAFAAFFYVFASEVEVYFSYPTNTRIEVSQNQLFIFF